MQLPQFTLRDLFVSTTITAVGVGITVLAYRIELASRTNEGDGNPEALLSEGVFFLLFLGGLLIGLGLFWPFHKPVDGAFCGAILGVLFMLLLPAPQIGLDRSRNRTTVPVPAQSPESTVTSETQDDPRR